MSTPRPEAGSDPAPHQRNPEPWLVVVDMQQVFGSPGSFWATPRFAEILPRVRELIVRFAPRVVLTRFVAPVEPSGAWVDYYADWPDALTPPEHHQYDLVAELSDLQLPVISRTTFGKWDDELASLVGSAELIMVGVSTDCCVISTALPAADAGVPVRVVADACAGASDADHQRALDAMSLFAPLITITDTATMLSS